MAFRSLGRFFQQSGRKESSFERAFVANFTIPARVSLLLIPCDLHGRVPMDHVPCVSCMSMSNSVCLEFIYQRLRYLLIIYFFMPVKRRCLCEKKFFLGAISFRALFLFPSENSIALRKALIL